MMESTTNHGLMSLLMEGSTSRPNSGSLSSESFFSVKQSSEFTLSPENDLTNITLLNTTSEEEMSGVPIGIEIMMYIMYITVAVTAVGGNGVVCYLILAYQKMRTVTNFFIINMALGDILMAILCIPFGFVANLLLQYWPFGSILCIVVSYSQAVSVFISAYTLIAISIDRYIAILYPLRPRMTKLQAKLIIGGIWLVSILTPLPTALLSKLVQPEGFIDTDRFICTEVWKDLNQRYYYSMALMILQYVFPLTVLIYTYARIAWVVWGKKTPGEAEDTRDRKMAASKRKMVKMMIMCVTTFTLCWLPFNSLVVIGDQYPDIYSFDYILYVWFACHFLAMSHACYNPFIYIWMNSKFRDGFHYILQSLIPCVPPSDQVPDFVPHCSMAVTTRSCAPGGGGHHTPSGIDHQQNGSHNNNGPAPKGKKILSITRNKKGKGVDRLNPSISITHTDTSGTESGQISLQMLPQNGTVPYASSDGGESEGSARVSYIETDFQCCANEPVKNGASGGGGGGKEVLLGKSFCGGSVSSAESTLERDTEGSDIKPTHSVSFHLP